MPGYRIGAELISDLTGDDPDAGYALLRGYVRLKDIPTDLRGDRVMRAVRERKLHYEDLCVADAMTPLSMLDAIDFDRLKAARVSNVVATLRRHGRNHLLVIEAASNAQSERVRGVISRAQVERQLGTVIEASGLARDLAEIEQALS